MDDEENKKEEERPGQGSCLWQLNPRPLAGRGRMKICISLVTDDDDDDDDATTDVFLLLLLPPPSSSSYE